MTSPTSNPADASPALASLVQRKVYLEVNTLELCLLALLHLRARSDGLAEFGEQELYDAFEQTCDAVEPSAENVRSRFTHAMRRLREQRLLTRVDGAGVVRAGQYALTRLASSIVEFHLEEQVLTPENLSLLTRTIAATLAQALACARQAQNAEHWEANVVAPLNVTVQDLIRGVERRQRGLDLQQEEFQQQVGQLLSADWFGAIEQCQALLDQTSATLRELNDMLLHDTQHLQALLQELMELAQQAGAAGAELVCQQLMDSVDRINAWGAARQQAWSEYYEYVHRYLRDVVRLDPARALSQRLREQLACHGQRPFSLTVAAAPSMRMLRGVEARVTPPPVRRPRKPREVPPEAEPAGPDAMSLMETRVREELAAGVDDLRELTARILADVPQAERFLVAGRIAEIVGRLVKPFVVRERPWVEVSETLAIEQRAMQKRSVG